MQNIGFDMETGLLLTHRPKPLPEFSDNKIIKEGEHDTTHSLGDL